MYLKNIIKHLKLITKHKLVVFKLCCKVGEPWRGFMHDWSKYSPTEFIESVKYYNGKCSPINICRKEKGYSEAWLHHKGRNKHHLQYWVDENSPIQTPIIPYKYAVEMICDKLAAGMIYKGKEFTPQYELDYWNEERKVVQVNTKIDKFITVVLTKCVDDGIDNTLKKKKIKSIYENIVNEKNNY